jgi:TDG/mug DNA glycosylase family protein
VEARARLVKSLDPIINDHARVLVLGSMPGAESLRLKQYYANPRNDFWPIIDVLFGREVQEHYPERVAFVQQQGIALWDVLAEASRKGSLDSSIKDGRPNDIQGLLTRYPNIVCIGLNGSRAAKDFGKYAKKLLPDGVDVIKLPSTSPTPGLHVKSYEEKLAAWAALREYLKPKA